MAIRQAVVIVRIRVAARELMNVDVHALLLNQELLYTFSNPINQNKRSVDKALQLTRTLVQRNPLTLCVCVFVTTPRVHIINLNSRAESTYCVLY